MRPINRREFLARSALAALAATTAGPVLAHAADAEPAAPARFFFTSQGRTAIVNADGGGLRYFDFQAPGQATWQPGPSYSDGRRVVVLSMEPRRDGPGRPFDEYYTQTPTHIWIYDLASDELAEICNKERLAPFETPALLVDDDRLLVQVVRNRVGQIFSMRLDGSDPREFTRAGEGLPYGFSLAPTGNASPFTWPVPRVIKSGPATRRAAIGCAWRPAPIICTLAPVGRPTAVGFYTSIACRRRIPVTIGPKSASAAPTAASIAC